VSDLLVGVWLGEALAHRLQGRRLALGPFGLVYLLTPRREVPPPVGEVALGRDPVVVERAVVVLQQRHGHLRAVADTDRRLVGFLRQSTRRVQAVDARPAGYAGRYYPSARFQTASLFRPIVQ